MEKCSDAAVVFVTDAGFALPTLIAAIHARRAVSTGAADVCMVTHSMESHYEDSLRQALNALDISHFRIAGKPWEQISLGDYNRSHVPPSALARFFLPPELTGDYRRILYLDGDTIPVSRLDTLVLHELDEGIVAAAEDRAFIYAGEIGRTGQRMRRYMRGIGVDPRAGYFNSGVLLANTDTWREVSKEAFRFFQLNTSTCLFHDQSALNAVLRGARLRLSPRFNWQTSFSEWGAAASFTPSIFHFAGGSKPWKERSARLSSFTDLYEAEIGGLRSAGLFEEGTFGTTPPLALTPDTGTRISRLLGYRKALRCLKLLELDRNSAI